MLPLNTHFIFFVHDTSSLFYGDIINTQLISTTSFKQNDGPFAGLTAARGYKHWPKPPFIITVNINRFDMLCPKYSLWKYIMNKMNGLKRNFQQTFCKLCYIDFTIILKSFEELFKAATGVISPQIISYMYSNPFHCNTPKELRWICLYVFVIEI